MLYNVQGSAMMTQWSVYTENQLTVLTNTFTNINKTHMQQESQRAYNTADIKTETCDWAKNL